MSKDYWFCQFVIDKVFYVFNAKNGLLNPFRPNTHVEFDVLRQSWLLSSGNGCNNYYLTSLSDGLKYNYMSVHLLRRTV